MNTTTRDEVRGTRLLRQRGPWQRLGVILVCIDLLVMGVVAVNLGGGSGRGIAFAKGGSDVDPVSYLGSTFDHTGCQSAALSIGKGEFVVCEDWSAVTNGDHTAKVVSLYAAGNPVIDEYAGALPAVAPLAGADHRRGGAARPASPDHGHVRDPDPRLHVQR